MSATPLVLNAVLRGYVDAALWATPIGDDFAERHNVATGEDWCGDTGMADFGFTAADIDTAGMASMREDVAAMVEAAGEDFDAYCLSRGYNEAQSTVEEYFGHDFLLSRDGHGAGFWDRGLGALGERLHALAKPFGESGLYVGDDSILYVA